MIKTWKNLPTQFNKTLQISTVYALAKTIRSKIFNHNEFIKKSDTKDILDNMNNLPCKCTTSPFTDQNHEHIVTGDICIVQNTYIYETAMQRTQIQGNSFH